MVWTLPNIRENGYVQFSEDRAKIGKCTKFLNVGEKGGKLKTYEYLLYRSVPWLFRVTCIKVKNFAAWHFARAAQLPSNRWRFSSTFRGFDEVFCISMDCRIEHCSPWCSTACATARPEEQLKNDAESIGVAAVKYFDLRQNRNSDYRHRNAGSVEVSCKRNACDFNVFSRFLHPVFFGSDCKYPVCPPNPWVEMLPKIFKTGRFWFQSLLPNHPLGLQCHIQHGCPRLVPPKQVLLWPDVGPKG